MHTGPDAGDAAAGDAVVGTASDDAGDAAGDVVATTASVAFVVTAVASATLKIRAVESPGLLSQGGPPGEKLSLSGKSQLSLVIYTKSLVFPSNFLMTFSYMYIYAYFSYVTQVWRGLLPQNRAPEQHTL